MSDLSAKRHAPATLRNREAIAGVLAKELPDEGLILEVASGSGEHAIYFAERFPTLAWQPSDPDPDALASISAYREEYLGQNCQPPVQLDAASSDWPVEHVDAILCINMVHISPWEATTGLFAGAAQRLQNDAPLILYGPYFEAETEPAPSNLAFDESLRSRNPDWGIRSLEELDQLASMHGFARSARHAMPANNLTVVYRRTTVS